MQGATCFIVGRIRENFFAPLLWSVMTLTLAFPLHAEPKRHGTEPEYFDFDESQVEKWKESETTIPSYPRDADLLAVPPELADTVQIFIDRRSISRAADRVARFSLVVESASGARSVFYEGLRCETREYKTYALGSAEGKFQPSKEAAWRKIPRPAMNAFRHQLYHRFICDEHSSARAPEDIVRLLMP